MAQNSKRSQAHSSTQQMDQEQPSQAQSFTQTSQRHFPKEQIEEAANDVLTYLLKVQRSNKPVKRTKILKNVSTVNGRMLNEVIALVRTQLKEVFDIDLKETDDRNTQYFLMNKQHEKSGLKLVCSMERRIKIILLLILTVIKKNGGAVKQDDLLSFFRMCEIIDDVNNPIGTGVFYGIDFIQLLRTELVEMLYLKCNEVNISMSSHVHYEYMWGERADKEASHEEIDNFYQKVCSGKLEDITK